MSLDRTVTRRGDFVLLRADTLRLLLPQHEVAATGYIDHAPLATGEPGRFALPEGGGAPQDLWALSPQLRPLERFPADRFLYTRLAGAGAAVALAWNEVRVLIGAELALHALPAVMRGAGDLVDAYVELDGELAFCTTARRVRPQAWTPQA